MKTTTLFILALLYTINCPAQTHYYLEPKTFQEEGYTYQCDIKAWLVTLYNKDNKLTYEDNIDKRTGEVFVPNGKGPHIAEETWSKPKCYSIVNQAFSPEEKARVAGKEFTIALYINSQTGKIMEVDFNFIALERNPYTTIPVSVFRKIEVELKKNVWFTPSEEGKNMSYILLCWRQDPNVTIKNKLPQPLTPPIGPVDDNDIRTVSQ